MLAIGMTTGRQKHEGEINSVKACGRPVRRSAGSTLLGRLVAAITITWQRRRTPSISVSSWDTILLLSSPETFTQQTHSIMTTVMVHFVVEICKAFSIDLLSSVTNQTTVATNKLRKDFKFCCRCNCVDRRYLVAFCMKTSTLLTGEVWTPRALSSGNKLRVDIRRHCRSSLERRRRTPNVPKTQIFKNAIVTKSVVWHSKYTYKHKIIHISWLYLLVSFAIMYSL